MRKNEISYHLHLKTFSLIICILLNFKGAAQIIDTDIQQLIEFIQQNSEEDDESDNFDFDLVFENLIYLNQNKINLNKADLTDLRLAGIFNSAQINSLIKHREDNGKLISIYELQAIPNFEVDYIRTILPFIKVDGDIDDFHIKFSKLIGKGTHQLFLRYHQKFPTKTGITSNKYLGNSSKVYFRYKYNYGNKFYYGITAEKDEGEPMFKEKNKAGFDFYSFHLFWRKNTKWRALALGDYQVNLGQGLVLWSGFGFKKSTNTSLVKKEGTVLKPFTSVNEYLYLRGAAFTYQLKDFSFTPFLSYKKVDANISYTDSTETGLESNRIQVSGYHRTESEMEAKNAITELKAGFNTQFRKRDKHIGLNMVYSNFSHPLTFEEKAYNKYQFQGKNLINTSLDYHYLIKSFHFFGENAMSFSANQTGYALLNGVMFNPDKNVDMSIVHRYYAPQYQTTNYTNAFAESTTPNNEHGIYFGIQLKPIKYISISSYYDFYQFPWLKYRADLPSKGNDFISQLKYKPNKYFEIYATYKREQKEENTKIDLGSNNAIILTESNKPYINAYFNTENFELNDLNQEVLRANAQITKQEIEAATFITPILTQRLRFHVSYTLNKTWTLQSRAEFSFYNDKINTPQTGFMLFQDVKFNKINVPFAFSTRIALFDVPQYDSRIYAYENDVLYQFSIPAFYNTGMRFYLNMQYKASNTIQFWLRFAHTYYSDIKNIGSGNDTIESNKLYEIKVQMRVKL